MKRIAPSLVLAVLVAVLTVASLNRTAQGRHDGRAWHGSPPSPTLDAQSVAGLAAHSHPRTHALTYGRVIHVDAQPNRGDGDYHVVLQANSDPRRACGDVFCALKGKRLVLEIMARYLPMELPRRGDQIRVWGITRWDRHGWGEIHPVLGWRHVGATIPTPDPAA